MVPPGHKQNSGSSIPEKSLMTDLIESVGAVESVKAASDIVRTDFVNGLN